MEERSLCQDRLGTNIRENVLLKYEHRLYAGDATVAHAVQSSTATLAQLRCGKRHLFLSFPYVCPEPVLAK